MFSGVDQSISSIPTSLPSFSSRASFVSLKPGLSVIDKDDAQQCLINLCSASHPVNCYRYDFFKWSDYFTCSKGDGDLSKVLKNANAKEYYAILSELANQLGVDVSCHIFLGQAYKHIDRTEEEEFILAWKALNGSEKGRFLIEENADMIVDNLIRYKILNPIPEIIQHLSQNNGLKTAKYNVLYKLAFAGEIEFCDKLKKMKLGIRTSTDDPDNPGQEISIVDLARRKLLTMISGEIIDYVSGTRYCISEDTSNETRKLTWIKTSLTICQPEKLNGVKCLEWSALPDNIVQKSKLESPVIFARFMKVIPILLAAKADFCTHPESSQVEHLPIRRIIGSLVLQKEFEDTSPDRATVINIIASCIHGSITTGLTLNNPFNRLEACTVLSLFLPKDLISIALGYMAAERNDEAEAKYRESFGVIDKILSLQLLTRHFPPKITFDDLAHAELLTDQSLAAPLKTAFSVK